MMQKMLNVITSSRIGAGGGLMPLVGQLAKVFGPYGLPILAAAKGLEMLGEATVATAELMKKAAQSYYTSGGTPGELARADMIGRATGMNIGDMARQYQHAIVSGGLPTAYAGMHGISDTPGMPKIDAQTDYLKHLFDLADKSKTSDAQAMREVMINPALSPALQMRDMNPDDLKEMQAIQSKMFSPEARQKAAHYQMLIAEIGLGFDSFVTAVGTPILEFLNHITGGTQGMQILGESLGGMVAPIFELANTIMDALPSLDAFSDWISQLILDIASGDIEKIGRDAMNGPSARAAQTAVSATRENTAAIEEQTQILREGIYGGGSRSRDAIPGMYRGANGNNTERFLSNQANAMGAFGLGT